MQFLRGPMLQRTSMSKAAMFPMAKPYPEWTSGNPTLRPTIPGSAATFAICLTPGRKPPT